MPPKTRAAFQGRPACALRHPLRGQGRRPVRISHKQEDQHQQIRDRRHCRRPCSGIRGEGAARIKPRPRNMTALWCSQEQRPYVALTFKLVAGRKGQTKKTNHRPEGQDRIRKGQRRRERGIGPRPLGRPDADAPLDPAQQIRVVQASQGRLADGCRRGWGRLVSHLRHTPRLRWQPCS